MLEARGPGLFGRGYLLLAGGIGLFRLDDTCGRQTFAHWVLDSTRS